MKTRLWIITLLCVALPAFAAEPAALAVGADDLAAAGVSGATVVSPAGDRFHAPVHYFRITEKLSETDAKKDCTDCADLVAVYTAETAKIPGWAAEPHLQFIKIGGRLQVRAYIAAKKRVVTVTAPSETTARKISSYLVKKFSN